MAYVTVSYLSGIDREAKAWML